MYQVKSRKESDENTEGIFTPEDDAMNYESGIIHVSRGEVRPRLNSDRCGICGRTILMGETPEQYRTPQADDKSMLVCSVCRPQARDAGFSKVA